MKDPILLEFLKVWGKIEVERRDKIVIRDGLKKKYERKDFEAIPDRMREQKRSVLDVCNDPGLQAKAAWRHFAEAPPEFAEKAHQIHYTPPYSVQQQIRVHSRAIVKKSMAGAPRTRGCFFVFMIRQFSRGFGNEIRDAFNNGATIDQNENILSPACNRFCGDRRKRGLLGNSQKIN